MIIHDKLTLTHIAQAHPSWWVGGRMIGNRSTQFWEHAHCSVNGGVSGWTASAYERGLMVSKRRPEHVGACLQCHRVRLAGFDDESDD